ncbi:hypothetical protein HAX54_019202, partial [Datura stramonium]|nr:hypothetical protein [Datura stramonium]
EIMPPKFQPTIGGARRRSEKAETTRHLLDETIDSEGEVQEVGTNAPSPGYQTRSATRQQAVNPQFDEGSDTSAGGSSSSSDSPNSDEGSGNEAISIPIEDTKPIRVDIIKGKMPGIVEEVRIIDSELPEYLDIEAKYKFYGLGWMSEALGHYYPAMVCEFYASYIAILEGLCKKGQKPLEMQIQKCIPVWGEMVDISAETINRMLYGPDFTPPVNIGEFEYRMRERHNQRGWLAQFWWAVARLRLFPKGGDNTLAEDRVVPVASLVSGEAHVPILARIDVETYATKKYDLEKSKDESKYDLKLHKPILEVFGPNVRTTRAMETSAKPAGEAIGVELVFHATPIHTSTPSTSGVARKKLEGGIN